MRHSISQQMAVNSNRSSPSAVFGVTFDSSANKKMPSLIRLRSDLGNADKQRCLQRQPVLLLHSYQCPNDGETCRFQHCATTKNLLAHIIDFIFYILY